MAYSLKDRLAVTTLVHIALALLSPPGAGQTWTVTFSVSVVLLCGSALTRPDAEEGRAARRR